LPDSRRLVRRWVLDSIDPTDPFGLELYGPVFPEGERAFIIWPFFATQVPLVRSAFHAEFLDGLRYYVASGEISRRFEADSTHYPVETAYYRWLKTNAPIVWRSDPKRMSGPIIEVRKLPSRVSSRAERDRLFATLVPKPVGTSRLGLWCLDMARLFVQQREYDRAAEWARRGIAVGARSMTPRLYVTLCETFLRQGLPDSAEAYARKARGEYPGEYVFREYRGMALEMLERHEEARVELTEALRASGDPEIRINLAAALSSLKRYQEAAAVLEGVPADHPVRAVARRNLGILYSTRLGRPGDALVALRESIALDPDQQGAEVVRAEIRKLESVGTTPRPAAP